MAHQDIPIIGPVLARLVGTRNDRFVKKYTQRVDAINAREADMRKLTDAELRQQVELLRGRHDEGAKTEELLIDAFAVAREAMDRAVGIRAIFNPAHEFDASRLPESVRALYEETKAAMDATPPAAPEGEFLGHTEELPGWRQLDIPNEIYEAVRELYPQSRPPFRARPFDVQLIGGMVLSQGKIAEMKTGEGKTIVAPLACYLACVERRQVHVVTVNDYLVQRDRDWTFPFFRALGLTVGAIHPHHMQPEDEKRRMYECDVVYGTTSEFGFDYLRDNMKRSAEQQVQKGRHFAVVDEVDSTLIDEARTPLIISGLAHDYRPRYEMADELAQHLVERQKPWTEADGKVNHCKERIKGLEGDIRQSRDRGKVPELQKALAAAKAELPELERERDQFTQFYEVEMDRKQAHLTHEGIAEAQRKAGIGSFYVGENIDVPYLLEQSIRGYAVYQRDKDYIVMDLPNPQTGRNEPGVVIVDANTGRPMIGRQWSDGLHQAVEAKERVPIKQETQTVATITIQNYFKMYKRLSGMTGTADTEAQEFHDIYSLDVVAIPTNRPISRRDFEDLVFLRKKDKLDAIVEEIKAFHDVGRPILVGTTSVEMSETIAKLLQRKHQIQHEVLNAKQHEREANIVEDAGRMGAVMIATNMAGRGTDIKLGPVSRETMLDHWLRRGICSRGLTVDSTVEELRENVYRKVAPQYLEGVHKREAESMDFAELERKLLERWALDHTWLSEKQIASASVEGLREELDATGRFLLHDLRWFDSIEEMGGLHVIGTERHEARRIDNQLRGRSGRQGDNGSSRFFVSLEDDLMAMFAGQTTMRILSRLGMKEGDAIEHPMLSKSVERAQRKVEERNFQMRKNILEYDEVMEHQRQRFYGQRQRVLDGRDVRGLVFGYVEAAVDEAVGEYLDSDYPAQCAAEFAKEKLDCSIMPDRLRNRELMEVEDIVRKEAKQDARQNISVTLGEYMPMEGSEVSVDFDSAGLISWAKSRFGVELDAGELREGGASERRAVEARLEEAAEEQIDEADLSGLAEYTEEHYGAKQLIAWLSRKFTIEATVDEILEAKRVDDDSAIEGEGVADLIVRRVRELYDRREIEYPVDFALEMTMNQMRQDPASAMSRLVDWAKRKYGVELDPETIVKTPPKKVREDLLAVSERFVKDDTLGKTVDEAIAIADDDALDAWSRERFDVGMADRFRRLEGEEREHAVRAHVENILRFELLNLERAVLLDVFDGAWKDHLYEMDQLRDAIGFRAFSQQDPRIAFKKEGARLFGEMMGRIRERVTDIALKARLSAGPQAPAPQRPPQPRPAPAPAPASAPAAAPAPIGGMITGPGFGVPPAPASPPPAQAGAPAGEASSSEGDGPDAEQSMEAARSARSADKGRERRR